MNSALIFITIWFYMEIIALNNIIFAPAIGDMKEVKQYLDAALSKFA